MNKLITEEDRKLLEQDGWIINREKPLKISKKTTEYGEVAYDVATGDAALMVVVGLRFFEANKAKRKSGRLT